MEYLNSLQTCHTTESGIFIVFQSVGPLLTWIGYFKKFNQAPSFLSLDIQAAFHFWIWWLLTFLYASVMWEDSVYFYHK